MRKLYVTSWKFPLGACFVASWYKKPFPSPQPHPTSKYCSEECLHCFMPSKRHSLDPFESINSLTFHINRHYKEKCHLWEELWLPHCAMAYVLLLRSILAHTQWPQTPLIKQLRDTCKEHTWWKTYPQFTKNTHN